MMSVYGSMAHAVMHEHLRPVLGRDYTTSSDIHGLKVVCWKTALLAYGKEVYTLGDRMGIPPRAGNAELVKRHAYAAFTYPRALVLGISPLDLYSYETVYGATTAFTPIHIATALLRFAPTNYRKMAEELISPEFLRKHAKQKAPDTSSMRLNPYTPEELGLDFKYLPIEPGEYIDEIGNLAWFTPEYADKYFEGSRSREGLQRLLQLNVCHNLWWRLCRDGGKQALMQAGKYEMKNYGTVALHLRLTSADYANGYLSRLDGVRELLNICRRDASLEQMRKGLARLANTATSTSTTMYSYIGRELTIEDIRSLTPRQALEILYRAPMGAIRDLRQHNEEIGSIMFGVKDMPMLKIQNSLADHPQRTKKWVPDTDEGIAVHANSQRMPEAKLDWDKTYEPLVTQFAQAYTWRNDLLEAVDPDTAFLGIIHALSKPADLIPRVAIENVLATHPNIMRLNELIERMPEHLRVPTSL